MRSIFKAVLSTGVVICVFTGAPALAASVTAFGDDVSFTYDDATLFGVGTVVGNNIFFYPDDFRAESNGLNTSPDTISDTLDITITALNPESYALESVGVAERGDYRIGGESGRVNASLGLFAVSMTTPEMMAGRPTGFFMTADATADTGEISAPIDTLSTWSLSATTDFFWGGETQVMYTIQNNLEAYINESGATSYIQKKNGQVGILVNPVPVPAAAWFMGSALLSLALINRRRKVKKA